MVDVGAGKSGVEQNARAVGCEITASGSESRLGENDEVADWIPKPGEKTSEGLTTVEQSNEGFGHRDRREERVEGNDMGGRFQDPKALL